MDLVYNKFVMLTLKAPVTTAAGNILKFFFLLFFKENKSWYFMWIVCLADDSHEISRLVFFEKLKKIKINVVCYKFCLAQFFLYMADSLVYWRMFRVTWLKSLMFWSFQRLNQASQFWADSIKLKSTEQLWKSKFFTKTSPWMPLNGSLSDSFWQSRAPTPFNQLSFHIFLFCLLFFSLSFQQLSNLF